MFETLLGFYGMSSEISGRLRIYTVIGLPLKNLAVPRKKFHACDSEKVGRYYHTDFKLALLANSSLSVVNGSGQQECKSWEAKKNFYV